MIPPTLEEALGPFVATLREVAEVRSVVLFGSHARGEALPRSDVNVLVVLSEARSEVLARLSPAFVAARRSVHLEPFLLVESEIARIADVFPLKLLEIRACHRVLLGTDPLERLEVHPAHLRLRVEQELRNHLLRLRRAVLESANDPGAILRAVRRAASSVRVELWGLLRASGREVAVSNEAVFAAASESFGLDRETLQALTALRSPQGEVDALALAGRLLALLEKASRAADALEEAA